MRELVGVAFHFVTTRPVMRGQRVLLTVLLLATFWHVYDAWQGREDRAQAARLEEAVRLREAERALFQGTVETWPALVDEHARLKRALEDLLFPDRCEGHGCWVANYIMQISGLIERVAKDEHDSGMELTTVTSPARSSFVPKSLRKYGICTYKLTVNGHYESIVRLLKRLQSMEYQRVVTLTRVALSPRASRWDGLWTARVWLTVYLYPRPEEL